MRSINQFTGTSLKEMHFDQNTKKNLFSSKEESMRLRIYVVWFFSVTGIKRCVWVVSEPVNSDIFKFACLQEIKVKLMDCSKKFVCILCKECVNENYRSKKKKKSSIS